MYITCDGYQASEGDGVVYCKTDFLFSPGEWKGRLIAPYSRNAKVLVIGHSDYPLTNEMVTYLKHPGLKRIFAVNAISQDPLVTPIPLGLTNNTNESFRHPIYGNTAILDRVKAEPREIKGLAYLNFNIHTYPTERQVVFNLFSNQQWATIGNHFDTLEARTNFLREIRSHRFVFCPRGNGVDTHRLWETLYMGSIPIVRMEPAYRSFTNLPILFINSWEEVTPEFLLVKEIEIKGKNWDLSPLSLEYWVSKFRAYADE